jgi:hypothetical protein
MGNQFTLINPSAADERQDQAQPINDDLNAVCQTVEQTRNDIRLTRRTLDTHMENCESGFRGVHVLWAIVIAVVLGLIGLSWYGYSYMNGNGPLLAQIPDLQQLAKAADDRMSSMDGKLKEWAMDRVSLTDRIAKLEKTTAANLRTARNQAQSLANEVGQRVRQEMAENLQRLQARLGNVESTQRETQDRVSQLQTEIGNVRQEMASMQQQNAQLLTELEQSTQADVNRIDNHLTTMQSQVIAHNNRLQTLSDEVDRERITFELSGNHTQQIASGIYLTVSHTDVAHQRVDGWMQLADEGRIIWIRGLGAQEALTFVTRADNRTHELVFTAVQQNGVAGYVLRPTSNSQSPVLSSN